MALRLTEEQREIRALAREFAAAEIRPFAADWDERRELDPAVFAKLGELGFLGMRIPEAHGGLELDLATYLLVLEELSWGDASVTLPLAIHSGPVSYLLTRYGTPEQNERYLPRLAAGELMGVFALTEAGAGSDARALAASWAAEDGGYLLKGKKKWVTGGAGPALAVVFAREAGGEPVSAFLVESGAPGYQVGKREVTMGLSACSTVEVALEGVRVGPEGLLGEVGAGFGYAMEALDVGRLGIAVQALGIGRAAMEHARAYALERVQFGKPLAEFQATRFKLAEMATRLSGARALAGAATEALEAWLQSERGDGGGGLDDEAPSPGTLAAMAKLVATEAAVWITDEAVQIFGGYGYMRDYPVEKLLRDAKGTEIYEGTNEIMRLVVARDVFRGTGA